MKWIHSPCKENDAIAFHTLIDCTNPNNVHNKGLYLVHNSWHLCTDHLFPTVYCGVSLLSRRYQPSQSTNNNQFAL